MAYDETIHFDDPMFAGHAAYTGGGNDADSGALATFNALQQRQQAGIPGAKTSQKTASANEAARGANFRNSVVNDKYPDMHGISPSVVAESKNRVAYDQRRAVPAAEGNKQWEADYSRDSAIVNSPFGEVGHTKDEIWAAQQRFAQNKRLTKSLNTVLTGDTTVVDPQNLKNIAPGKVSGH